MFPILPYLIKSALWQEVGGHPAGTPDNGPGKTAMGPVGWDGPGWEEDFTKYIYKELV